MHLLRIALPASHYELTRLAQSRGGHAWPSLVEIPALWLPQSCSSPAAVLTATTSVGAAGAAGANVRRLESTSAGSAGASSDGGGPARPLSSAAASSRTRMQRSRVARL